VEWLSRLKLDLEAVDKDASDEVLEFEIQISLIYSKLVGLYIIGSYHHILSPTISEFLSESLTQEDYLKESPHTGLVFEPQQCSLPCYLQQRLYTLVKEKFLSMLGSWICPIEWTPVIIQVASQLLPRVTPEKIHIEVSHCLGLDQDSWSYTLKCLHTTTYSCDTLVAGLVLQSAPVDWWCLYWIHGDTDPSIYNGTGLQRLQVFVRVRAMDGLWWVSTR